MVQIDQVGVSLSKHTAQGVCFQRSHVVTKFDMMI